MLDLIANAYNNLRQKVGICAYFNPQKAKNHAMQYHELKNLTAGQCTPEEFAAIEAVYMSREDMTKRQAAALWRRLYSRKHRAAAAETAAELATAARELLAIVGEMDACGLPADQEILCMAYHIDRATH